MFFPEDGNMQQGNPGSFLENILALQPVDMQEAFPPADPRDGLGPSLMSAALVRAAFIQPVLLPQIYDELAAITGLLSRGPSPHAFHTPEQSEFPDTGFWVAFWNLVARTRIEAPAYEELWEASCVLQTRLPVTSGGEQFPERDLVSFPGLPRLPAEATESQLLQALGERLGRERSLFDAAFIAVLGTVRSFDDAPPFSQLLLDAANGWVKGKRLAA